MTYFHKSNNLENIIEIYHKLFQMAFIRCIIIWILFRIAKCCPKREHQNLPVSSPLISPGPVPRHYIFLISFSNCEFLVYNKLLDSLVSCSIAICKFILFSVHWTFWMYRFVGFFFIFGNFQPLFFHIVFFTSGKAYMHVLVCLLESQKSLWLCSFFFHSFFFPILENFN